MERFFGFDLGDAESAVSRLEKEKQTVPDVVPVGDAKSFITAYAVTSDGQLLIGENACYAAAAKKRKLRFKSRFLTDPTSAEDVKSFAAGVLGELYTSGELVQGEDTCVYVGCPAGWDRNARELYRSIFEKVGYPPVRIISESRAALISACQSKHLQIGYDILAKPVLVVDIGSSTTDFAYICGGKEVEIETAGEVVLGGGIMDELLLGWAVEHSEARDEILRVFRESEPWKTYCEFAARRLKEKYFSDVSYWREHPCTETVLIRYDTPIRLVLTMDETIAEHLVKGKSERLGGRSFYQVFKESLMNVKHSINGKEPELLFLTGGVSKMPSIRSWCIEAFSESVVILGNEPEFSVSRGLAFSGRIDEDLRAFRRELEELKASSTIEEIVSRHIDDLYMTSVNALVDPILEQAAVPVFDRWRNGEIARLSDTDEELACAIAGFLRSDEAREILKKPIAGWLKQIADEIEEHTVPICIRHGVPYTALSLSSFLDAGDLEIQLDARNVFAVEEVTLMIDSIISIMVGLLCGGSGIALIASGPNGILAGVLLSLLVLILGKKPMEKAIMDMKLPKAVRKMVPKRSVRTRLRSLSADVKKDLIQSLMQEKNEEITARMVDELALQIEACLTKMAEVVEIPLA